MPAETKDTALYGGKGAMLLLLKELGYPVPEMLVLPVTFFNDYTCDESLLAACNERLREWQTMFGKDAKLAVRSSAVAEDGNEHSFAGQFKSLLNVEVAALPEAIIKVWKSGDEERVNAYRKNAGLEMHTAMAVIIQKMIPATAAGVCFGINPMNGRKETVINAVAGLGDKLVDGTANADTYIVKEGQISKQPADHESVLEDNQIKKIAECVKQLNEYFGIPQDIEFAFAGNDFYLLQSRPVTATEAQQERIIWDNSNIVESYPALTLPLTFSFIEQMYEAVYRQFALVLGVSSKVVKRNEAVYACMLGLLNGRVYYNLNSWYRALAQLPGYSLNASFMEKMMGVKEQLNIDVSAQIKASRIAGWRDVLVAVVRIFGNLRHARKEKESFTKAFDAIYAQYEQKDFSGYTLQEIWADYSLFERLMVQEWKAPLSNDFFAMVYFGLLQKQCATLLSNHPQLHNQLLAGSDDIVTTQPLKQLPKLAAMLAGNEQLLNACKTEDAASVWKLLQQPEYARELQAIHKYLRAWGERSLAELKLETITYVQQPEKLIAVLQSYIANGIFRYHPGWQAKEDRQIAETAVQQQLKGKPLKRWIFNHVLKQARYFVSNRENLRYYRTKAFGMVRRMMIAYGEQLYKAGFLEDARDVFFLKLKEVETLAQLPVPMQETVVARKASYRLFEQLSLPERVETNGIPQQPIIMATAEKTFHEDDMVMKGIPCSAGVVRSVVYKVDHAAALQSLNGGILATYATDPGYVVLFATASGIITERGSLLSHAAIVSREMGIPCIVGVEGLMSKVKDGDELLMDGSTGVIKILNRNE